EVVRAPDVVRISGECDPAEGSLPLAEQRPDVLRHESRNVERVRQTGIVRNSADVVAVVERDSATLLQLQHRSDVSYGRFGRAANVLVRIALSQLKRFLEGHSSGYVSVQHVMGAGLVGDNIRTDSPGDQ